MKYVNKLLLVFLFLLSLFLLPSPINAAPSGKVGFGPIEVNLPGNVDPGQGEFEIDVTTEAGNYTFRSGRDSGCPPRGIDKTGPCIGQQDLDANPNGPTTVSITDIRWLIGGNESSNYSFLITQGSTTRTLSTTQDTGWISYQLTQSGATSGQTSAAISITPNPNINKSSINAAINGKGHGSFIFRISKADGTGGSEAALRFKVDTNGCTKIDGSTAIFPGFTCNITNATNQTWSVAIVQTNNLTDGAYRAHLSDGADTIANETFINGAVSQGNINVTANPSSGLRNDVDNEITLSWTPEVGSRYTIVTTAPGLTSLPTVTCTNNPCTTKFTLPKGLSAGSVMVTVSKDGDSSKFGRVIITLNSSTVTAPIAKVDCSVTPDECSTASGVTCDPATGNDIPNGSGIKTAIGCIPTEPTEFINRSLRFVAGMAGAVALLLMIFGAFRMIVSTGDPEGIKAGKDQFMGAVYGLIFILMAITLLQIIGVDILAIPGFSR